MQSYIKPRWKKVEYSRSKIVKAGKTIRNSSTNTDEYINAVKIIDNWRASHAYPMHVIYMHLRRMCKGKDAIVAERLKRLDSITKKLKREPNMNLWTMQDLGGCRVIVSDVDDVYCYADIYERSRKRHVQKNKYDYIQNPKASGYRSLHVVYEYKSDTVETYNKNMLIEIQYRTHLQHLWATAVETMGLFTKEAIKAGQGSEDVKRFFVLVSALFAIREKQPIPPNVSNNEKDILEEIRSLNEKNNYLGFLSGIRVAIEHKDDNIRRDKMGYFILILNYDERHLSIKYYKSSEIEKANETYNLIEKSRGEAKIDAVLVRVSSFSDLKRAYPNYFSDIGEFIDIVEEYLDL